MISTIVKKMNIQTSTEQINHKAKNNLQFILGLIDDSFSCHQKNIYLEILKNSNNLIKSIGFIHREMQQNECFLELELCQYIDLIINNLYQMHKKTPNDISFIKDVDNIFIDFNTALCIGFILLEFTSHFFTHTSLQTAKNIKQTKDKKKISLQLHIKKNGCLTINIQVSGIRFLTNPALYNTETVTFALTSTLIEELQGKFVITKKQNLEFGIILNNINFLKKIEKKDKKKILIVEDEILVIKDIEKQLNILNYHVLSSVNSGEEALNILQKTTPDLILMDIMLKGQMDGIQTAEKIQKRYRIPVIYLSAYSDINTLQRVKKSEPFGYIIKPFNINILHSTIELALYRHELEELKSQKHAVEESNRLKADFINMIGHEFRTPLTSILGFAETIQRIIKLNKSLDKLPIISEKIVHSAEYLIKVINNILDMSKIEGRKITLKKERLPLLKLISEMEILKNISVTDKKITIDTKIDDNIHVYADSLRLQQIMTNLISNAIKYSPPKSTIIIEALSRTGKSPFCKTTKKCSFVEISVKDEALGIPKEHYDLIFEPFHRIDVSGKIPGDGLGLAITKKFVELHDGKIWVRRRKNKGSSFHFTLPKEIKPNLTENNNMNHSSLCNKTTHIH